VRRRIGKDEVLRRLRRAGRDGELDADRVLYLVDARIELALVDAVFGPGAGAGPDPVSAMNGRLVSGAARGRVSGMNGRRVSGAARGRVSGMNGRLVSGANGRVVSGATSGGYDGAVRIGVSASRRSWPAWVAVPVAAALAVGVLVVVNTAAGLLRDPGRGSLVASWGDVLPGGGSGGVAHGAGPAGGSAATGATGTGTPRAGTAGTGTPGAGATGSGATAAGRSGAGTPGTGRPGAGATGSGATQGLGPSTVTTGAGGGAVLAVTPVPVGAAYRLPLHSSQDLLVVGSVAEPAQVRVPVGASEVGPAQSLGSGQSAGAGPFALSWSGPGGATPGQPWRRWVTSPGSFRGSPAGLRIPVRVKRVPATITLLVGTVGGGGRVQVEIGNPSRSGIVLTAALPDCGTGSCPAVVTITQNVSPAGTSSTEDSVDLRATSAGALVGLAAVELD
jgi:hypothetical protein